MTKIYTLIFIHFSIKKSWILPFYKLSLESMGKANTDAQLKLTLFGAP
jgi:hypothetical protein